MELITLRRRIQYRSLRFDLLAACAAVLMGILVAYVIWAVTPLEGRLLIGVTAAASGVFLATLLPFGARDKGRALARAVGAEIGWLGFLWIIGTDVVVWIYVVGWFVPGVWWVLFVALALALVSAGLIASDRVWTWVRGSNRAV
ncbi:MAG: hypothetical protein A3K59_02055 [Euryarchaeota archaeon RBG_19FT_COMBO_69_17]|nr:MAG: hypothetical protein A3K59_02055 [Euryarchaeota archaeon RBG_19FT_COMBO_69_17]